MRPEGLTGRNVSIGPPVKKGSIGHHGHPGVQGLQSHPVLDGIPGVQGLQGLPGPQGNPGPVGFKVDKGNAELTGPQGPVEVQRDK